MNKKIQVFVSSTYTDLIEERQSAVEAILDAGHIPAGMELFKAGNKSQLQTIYKWIDESDVYMLILGGRYGSIEQESGKSYTQLEYEYALSKRIPVFAVVLSDLFVTNKIKTLGLSAVTEQNDLKKYQEFKKVVMSKVVRMVDDCKDIKIAIHTTLSEFFNEYNLIGWVRNNGKDEVEKLLKENNLLLKKNKVLNEKVQELSNKSHKKSKMMFGDYTYDELVKTLTKKEFVIPVKYTNMNEEVRTNALQFWIVYYSSFVTGVSNQYNSQDEEVYVFYNIAPFYVSFGLLDKTKIARTTSQMLQTTKVGDSFYAMLEFEGMTRKNMG